MNNNDQKKGTLTLVERPSRERGRLVFEIELDTADRKFALHRRSFRTLPMDRDPSQDFKHLIKILEDADGRRNLAVETHIADTSLALFDALFPAELKEKLRETLPEIDTLHIISHDHLIPWELCRLKSGKGGDSSDFLCATHAVTRWYPGLNHPADYLPAKNLAASTPHASNLIYSRQEHAELLGQTTLFTNTQEIKAGTQDIKQALKTGAWDIFHFTGHGQRDEINPDRSRILLDRNEYLTPANLADVRLGTRGMLVFLNACGTGSLQFSTQSLGGWARSFIKAGVGGFIGCAWDVLEKPAYRFAQAFYQALTTGISFGEAIRRARLEIRGGDGTWLAYVGFGDALASNSPAVDRPIAAEPPKIAADDEDPLFPDFLGPSAKLLLEEFKNFLNKNKACVLLGDQLAPRSGLPDDAQLLRLLARKVDRSAGDLDLAQLTKQYGAARTHQWLAELLHDEDKPLSDVCQILSRAPFQSYITLQRDRLLEWSLKDAGRNGLALFLPADLESLRQLGKDLVVKLRGTVEHPHTLWTSRKPPIHPKMELLARRCVAGKALLILGFDPAEPSFPPLIRRIAKWESQLGASLFIGNGIPVTVQKLLRSLQVSYIDLDCNEDKLPAVLGSLVGMSQKRVDAFSARRLIRANPFPGLAPYRAHNDHFYGREERLQIFHNTLDTLCPITVFFGESGVGKSSFFYAGLTRFLAAKTNIGLGVTKLPVNQKPRAFLRKFLADLANSHPSQTSENKKTIIVLDQFEQFFYSDLTKQEIRRFLSHDLPYFIKAAAGQLFFILVMRSDELHHLHEYRDIPGLTGLYHDSERFETLDVPMAGKVVQRIFLTKDYALTNETITALTATSCHNSRVYLPYLQLLGSRFFEFLEHKWGEQRGFNQIIDVPLPSFREFIRRGAHFSDYLHEVVLELSQLEPDRALILRLFDMLIDGSRRTSIRADLLKEVFAEPERIDFLLYQMVSRRLVHYDEVDTSYALVHDALVPFLNRYLDNQRIDYSRGELQVVARKITAGLAKPAIVENVALYCLRHRQSSLWIDFLALDKKQAPYFYLGLRRKLLPAELPFWWSCFASSCWRTGVLPSSLSTKEVIQALFMTKGPDELILALARLLTLMPLAGRDLIFLRRWIDPDPGDAVPPFPFQERASKRAFGYVLDALFAAPGVDPSQCFRGRNCLYFSKPGWWTVYFQKLLHLTLQNRVPEKRMIERVLESVSASETDDNQLKALACALKEYDPLPQTWTPIVQTVVVFLQRRSGVSWKRMSLALCEKLLPFLPAFVFQRGVPLLREFFKTKEAWQALSLLARAVQDTRDYQELCGRFLKQEDIKLKGFLFHALLKTRVEVDNVTGLVDGLGEVGFYPLELQIIAGVTSLKHPPFLEAFGHCLMAKDWLQRSRAFLASQLTDIWAVVPVIWLERIEELQASPKDKYYVAGRCAILTAMLLIEETEALPAEVRPSLPSLPQRSDPAEFASWWDHALPGLTSNDMRHVNVGEVLQGQLRSLHRSLQTQAHKGKVHILARTLDQWFQHFPDLSYSLSGITSPYACSLISDYPLFKTLCLLLDDEAVQKPQQAWLGEEESSIKEAGQTLACFAVLERAHLLTLQTFLVDEILDRMVFWQTKQTIDDGGRFLGAMLLRKNLQERPDFPMNLAQQQIRDALALAYAGTEATLIAQLSEPSLDYGNRIALLRTLEQANPGSGAKHLLECAFSLSEEPLGHALAVEALDALTLSGLSLSEREDIKTWARGLRSPLLAKPVMRILLGLTHDKEAGLIAAEKLLDFPELAPCFEAGTALQPPVSKIIQV